MLPIETVAVVGATAEGITSAVLASLAGCVVRVFDASDAALERAFEAVRRRVEVAYASGIVTRTERQKILDGLLFTPDLDEALTGVDLAVDAASGSGHDVVGHLADALRATTAIAAAGLASAAALASRVPQPGRVLALRLAEASGPVPRLDVEAGPGTTPHVLERAQAFAARVNRPSRVVVAP